MTSSLVAYHHQLLHELATELPWRLRHRQSPSGSDLPAECFRKLRDGQQRQQVKVVMQRLRATPVAGTKTSFTKKALTLSRG